MLSDTENRWHRNVAITTIVAAIVHEFWTHAYQRPKLDGYVSIAEHPKQAPS